MRKFNTVAIIGVGEIGGSIGKDLKRRCLAEEVIGVGRRRSSLLKAKKVGAVNRVTLSIENGVKNADLIILATPVSKIVPLALKAAPFAKKGAVITDAGSTKRHIVETLERALPKNVSFVGSHPMAGSEKGGPLNAQNNLFKGRVCFVTKTKRTKRIALSAIKKFWWSLGAKPIEISPKEHDRIVAYVSQMIHIVASALVISNRGLLKHTASGFRDTTRVALSDPGLWKDICVTNNREIAKALGEVITVLKQFKSLVIKKKAAQIQNLLNQAKTLRETLN